MKNFGIYLAPRVQWLSGYLANWGHDLLEHINQPARRRVAIDLMQGERCGHSEIDQYTAEFDHVILFNAETPLIIKDLARSFDHDRFTFITTGHMNFDFDQARVIEFENFFYEVKRIHQWPEMAQDLDQIRYAGKSQRFDALLGLSKPHRDFVHTRIQKDPSHFICTYYRHYNASLQDNPRFVWPDHATKQQQDGWSGMNVLYRGHIINLSHILPVQIYNLSDYSIVTETYTSNDFSFFTEKTAKCLLARRLFVMFAGQHYLRNLRALGFQTFDCVIDESYDLEPDADRRWHQAWQQVQRLCDVDHHQILESVASVLDHNHHHFMANDWSYQSRLALHLEELSQQN